MDHDVPPLLVASAVPGIAWPALPGPSGAAHERFRTWKEDLRDHPQP